LIGFDYLKINNALPPPAPIPSVAPPSCNQKVWEAHLFEGGACQEVSRGEDHDDQGEEEGEVDAGQQEVGSGTLHNAENKFTDIEDFV
jgi:hypothetical protein